MRRRTVVLGAAAGAMLAAMSVRAQQPGRHYRIGVLSPLSGLAGGPYPTAFREQLAGNAFRQDELILKQVELLTEVVPGMSHIAFLNYAPSPDERVVGVTRYEAFAMVRTS